MQSTALVRPSQWRTPAQRSWSKPRQSGHRALRSSPLKTRTGFRAGRKFHTGTLPFSGALSSDQDAAVEEGTNGDTICHCPNRDLSPIKRQHVHDLCSTDQKPDSQCPCKTLSPPNIAHPSHKTPSERLRNAGIGYDIHSKHSPRSRRRTSYLWSLVHTTYGRYGMPAPHPAAQQLPSQNPQIPCYIGPHHSNSILPRSFFDPSISIFIVFP